MKANINTRNKVGKDTWIDRNGKRWTKLLFDVMVDNVERFLRQISVTIGLHFDFELGGYVLDLEFGDPLVKDILRQHPTLAAVRNPIYKLTMNKVAR